MLGTTEVPLHFSSVVATLMVCCMRYNNRMPILMMCPTSQVKLEEALTLATDFHNSLQDFINWLTQAEQTLNMVSSASLILETIVFQIDEHKVMLVQRVMQPLT